jgi:hypothetical protein
MLKEPLDVARPKPETMEIAPPVLSASSPALTVTRPPVVFEPTPTITLTLPAAPLPPVPVRNAIHPDKPFVESLVSIVIVPLWPFWPAFAVRMLKAPLDVAVPKPDTIDTAPPVFAVAVPAWTVTRPPDAIVPG